MTDQEIEDWVARNGGERALMRFITVCLRHYEDVLWEEHEALLAHFRRQTGWLREYGYRADGEPSMIEPLFYEGGPPRYAFAIADPHERNARHRALRETHRLRSGLGIRKINQLWRRMMIIAADDDRSYAWRMRRMYRWYEAYASGENDRIEALIAGIVGTGVMRLHFLPGTVRAPAARSGAPAGMESPPPPQQVPPPQTGRTLQASPPPPPVPSSQTGTTLPGIGAAVEDIGHAPTVPAQIRGARRLPAVDPEIDDAALAPTLPAQSRRNRARSLERVTEQVDAEAPPSTVRLPRPEEGFPGPNGTRVVAMTPEQRMTTFRNMVHGDMGSNHYHGGRTYGVEEYAAAWAEFGGTGTPPPHGFIVFNPNRTIHRVVGFWPRGPGTP